MKVYRKNRRRKRKRKRFRVYYKHKEFFQRNQGRDNIVKKDKKDDKNELKETN